MVLAVVVTGWGLVSCASLQARDEEPCGVGAAAHLDTATILIAVVRMVTVQWRGSYDGRLGVVAAAALAVSWLFECCNSLLGVVAAAALAVS